MRIEQTKYQLRYAAGAWWLLDMSRHGGRDYQKPVSINECGAKIWREMTTGKDKRALVQFLCMEYGVSEEQAATDIDDFVEQLREQGIDLEEC